MLNLSRYLMVTALLLVVGVTKSSSASERCKSPGPGIQAKWRKKHSASLDVSSQPGKIVIESVDPDGLFKLTLSPAGIVERVEPLETPTYLAEEYDANVRPLVSKLKAGSLRDPAQAAQLLAGFEKSDEMLYVDVLNDEFPFPASQDGIPSGARRGEAKEKSPPPTVQLVRRMKQLVNGARSDLSCPPIARTMTSSLGGATSPRSLGELLPSSRPHSVRSR